MIQLSYDGFSLQTPRIITTDTDVYSAPQNNVQADPLSQVDGSVFVKALLVAKVFTIAGTLQGNSVVDCDGLVNTLKYSLRLSQRAFDIDYNGDTLRYIATPRNLVISRTNGLSTAGFSVEFICPSPVGSDTYGSILRGTTNILDSTALLSIVVDGTYQAEPVITLTINTVTSGTAKTVTINNASTLRGIAVTRNWINGDVLVIDSLNKTIYVNSIPVDFSGQFPKWDAGTGMIGYVDDFATRSVDIAATYTRRWL